MNEKNNLRKRAEVTARKKSPRPLENLEALSPEEIRKMFHELHVHQIELEMQNEELQAAHEELNASRDRYFDLFDLAPVGYISLNEEGLILEANFTAAELLGMERGALVKKPLPRFIHPNDQDIYYHHRKALFETGTPQTCDMRMVRADGALFWAIIKAAPAKNPDGTMGCRIMMIENTERKRSEKKLKSAIRYWDKTFDAIQDGIALLDPDQRVIHSNRAFQDMLQKTKKEITGRHCYHFIHGTDGPIPGCPFMRTKASKKREIMELEMDGKIFEVLVDPILDENGDISSAVHTAKDITERKQAEAALEQERTLTEALFKSVPGYLYIYDDQGKLIRWNKKMEELTGYSTEELSHMTIPKWFEGEDSARVAAAVENVFTTGYGEVEAHLLVKGGEKPFVHFNGIQLTLYGKTYLIGVGIDITERKRIENALRESEEHYRGLIDLAVDGILIGSHEGLIIEANQHMCAITGMTKENFIGKHISALPFTQECLQKTPFRFDLVQKGEIVINERTMIRPEGSEVSVEMRSRMMPDGTYQSIYRDITERKLAENVLRQFMASVYNSSDAIGMSTPEGKHYYQNEAFDELFGDIGDDPPATLYVDKSVGREVFKTIMAGGHWSGEVKMYSKDRRVLNILLRAYANKDSDGRIIGLSGIHTDITGRKVIEARLRKAEKMESVGLLAGGVAHDFNNMLGVILGFVELTLDKLDPADPMYDDLMEIRKAAQRSANLTSQLLAFARKQPVTPRPLDLNTTIAGILKKLQRKAGEGITLSWRPGPDPWPVNVDPSQIEQILSNLCDNSREAISGKGEITIQTKTAILDKPDCMEYAGLVPGEYVLLSFSDTGCGISREIIDRLFDPFFTTKETGKGPGLGLSTVYGIIKQNHGFIYALSQPGQGASFKIFLPRHKPTADEAGAEQPPKQAMGGNETILLVEDEPAVLKVAQMMLAHLGYTVVAANAPAEAIRMAEEQPGKIDLLITDVIMPGMNGRDLAQKLMSLYPDLKSLFMSGYTADIITRDEVLEEGVCFIQKPFLIKALAAKVREALEKQEN
ncbi:MAG: PAS domain S-box protein [Desulfobacteraceae bacterium]|nr:MAG: PAS domain S-box protein [Desulfobacteraceae bacterium]